MTEVTTSNPKSPKIDETPDTGDSSNANKYVVIAFVAAGVLAIAIIANTNKNSKKDA